MCATLLATHRCLGTWVLSHLVSRGCLRVATAMTWTVHVSCCLILSQNSAMWVLVITGVLTFPEGCQALRAGLLGTSNPI